MISPSTATALAAASTATIQSQLFGRGLRNTYLYGVRPLDPAHALFVAEAFTLRYIPAREDLDLPGVFHDPAHPQRAAIEQVGPGQVLVIDSRGDPRAASVGHILATRMLRRGAAGLVTDGSVRDSPAIRTMGFPVFSAGVSASTNLVLHHAVDFQVPIGCAGVPVYPGDVIAADGEGVVVIPRHLADEIAEPAAAQERLEDFIQQKVDGGASLPGTYPPGPELLAEYAQWPGSSPGEEEG